MSKLAAASLALAVVATATLAFGTGGFTSSAADRGVSVDVASDGNALVGYHTDSVTATSGETVPLVTIRNRLSSPVTVSGVSVEAGSFDVDVVDKPTLGSGERGAITGEVTCTPGDEEAIAVTVTVTGGGVSASIDGATREFTVACDAAHGASEVSNAKFAGKRQFKADTSGSPSVTYWTSEDGETFTQQSDAFDGKLKPSGDAGVVAVYFHDAAVTFVHPGFDAEDRAIDDWGQGNEQACAVSGTYDPTAATAAPCSATDASEPSDEGDSDED
jgi:hypothetical protein